MSISNGTEIIVRDIINILNRLEGNLLGQLAGSGSTVRLIILRLTQENLSAAEMMEILQRLRLENKLVTFLNLAVSYRDLREFLRDKQVPWHFVLQHWEPGINDSGNFFAGYVVGVGESIYEAIRLAGVIIGSAFSEELAKERRKFWEAIKQFISSPVLLIKAGIEQSIKHIENTIWNLEFFEAGRILGNLILDLLAFSAAVRELPKLFYKLAELVDKLILLTINQIYEMGVAIERLIDFVRNPQPLRLTPEGFLFMEAKEQVVIVDKGGRAVGRISKAKVLQEGKDVLKAKSVLKGLDRLSPGAKNWLIKNGYWEKAQKSFPHVGDDIIDAVNLFHNVDGFKHVIGNFLSGINNMQDGARFVMRYAQTHFADMVGKVAISFEMRSMDGMRFVDVLCDGVRYELKSVREISASFVKGSGKTFGQLTKDIVNLLDYKFVNNRRVLDLSRFENLRWVFNGKKIGLTEKQIIQTFKELIREQSLLKGHPNLKEIEKAIEKIVKVWSEE